MNKTGRGLVHLAFLFGLIALMIAVVRHGGLWPGLIVLLVGGVLYSVLRTLFPLSPED